MYMKCIINRKNEVNLYKLIGKCVKDMWYEENYIGVEFINYDFVCVKIS